MPATTPQAPSAPAAEDPARRPDIPYQRVVAGQPALVTGANLGIGRAIAIGLAKAEVEVVVNCVTDPGAADYVTGATLFVDGGMTLYSGFAPGG